MFGYFMPSHLPLEYKFLPAWKSMPTAKDVPDTGTKASDLSDGSNGMPRMPSCTEYSRKEPTPTANRKFPIFSFFALQMSHSTNPKYKSDHIRIVLCVRVCHTFTRLLPSAQAVSCSAHAGSGVWGGGETQLGTVSIVITTEICAWEPKETRTNMQNKIKEELQRHEQMCLE